MSTTEPSFQEIPQTRDKSSSYDFEMGYLLFSSGNFKKSLPYLEKAQQAFIESKDFSFYFSCYDLMIQAFNELGEKENAMKLNQEVKEFCKIHDISNTPRCLASLAYYSIYIERDLDRAKKEVNEALIIAFEIYNSCIKNNDRLKQSITRFDIMKCLYVYSIYYLETKDYENCIQEIKNIKILLTDYFKIKKDIELEHSRTNNVQELQYCHKLLEELKKNFSNIQRLQLGLKFLESLVETKYTKNYKQAEKLLWENYEEANKTNNIFFIPYILNAMSFCSIKLKNKNQAQMFFNLAKKNTTEERTLLIRYQELFKETHDLEQKEESENYDLILDLTEHAIVERQKGCIELKNQFILMDLLKLFLLNPGVPYSKEKIIEQIWKQDYRPETHDNKIYVTIKRLREIIEINSCKPYYICRNNAGYYFSKQAKVLLKQ